MALAAQAVLTWVRRGIDVCMNQVNGEPKPEKPKKDKPKKDKTEPGSSEGKQAEEPGAEKPRE